MLSHVGRYNGIAASRFPDIRDEMRHVELAVLLPIHNAARVDFVPPTIDFLFPLVMVIFIHQRNQIAQDGLQIADQWDIHKDIFMNFRGINLNVNLFRLGRIRFQCACHPVIETHAKGEDQI